MRARDRLVWAWLLFPAAIIVVIAIGFGLRALV
jgi:hypothetical protein